MDGFFSALSQHAFLQTAVVAALLASIGCGVMGTYVVVKRIAFLAVSFDEEYVHSLGHMMLIALLLGAVPSIAGLALSYGPDLPAGPTLVLLAGGAYVLSSMIAQVLDRRRTRRAAARGLRLGETRE